MSFEPARPRYTLPFAGKDYELLGTFALIEAVEYALKANIGLLAVQIVNGMPSHELAKVISTMLTACDHKMTAKEAGELLWGEVGLSGDENETLRLHLYSFLSVCLAPPGKREEKAKKMGEMIGKLTAPAASPGVSTGESASAS
ncbi:hypothetical protein P12x_005249 [Tundrisphaera lichenicola]|uniref:hypothetical protein n=1 Tax=Tundrisphaera lichenicola TaxID=2029860 RepID=UPI003EBF6DD0